MKKHRNILFPILIISLMLACNVPTPTLTPVGTNLPGTPTLIPPTATATPIGSTVPFAAPNDGPLNCRSGPGTNFGVVVVLAGTQSAEIVGKNPENTWWYVKNPYLVGNFCWVIGTFVNVTGDLSAIQVVGVPVTPTASTVIAVDMSIDNETIHVPDCSGPVQSVTISANIQTSGPMQIKAHFRDEQAGDLPTHDLNFTNADIQDISDTFTPPLEEGIHRVFLIIEGLDLSDLNSKKPYRITC
jgi:uncharacterized protein YraI